MSDPNLPSDPRSGRPPATPPPPAPSFVSSPPLAPPGFATPSAHPAPPAAPVAPTTPAPPAPPAAPGATAAFGDTSFLNDTTTIEDRIETKPSIVGRVGLVAAALAVAGGGAFAVTRALSEPAGAQTPEEAVDQLFEAVENDDLVGLTEVMLPSERESLIDPMVDLFTELERLEVLDEDFDFENRADEAGSDGLDFSVAGLQYSTTPIGEGVANAEITGGIVTVTGEVGDLPFGDRASAELDDEMLSESLDEQIVDFARETDARFTLVEEDGSWYVSLWYSVAEAAREDAGLPAPAFGQGVTPTGSSSPEAAVQAMMDRAVDLDAEGVIATLDPSEFRALHDYAPLFLDDAESAAAEVRQMAADEGVTWSLDRLDLSSSDVRGRTVVGIGGFAFSVDTRDESFSIDFDGQCFTAIENQQIDEICLDEITSEMDELPQAYTDFVSEYTSGITVVERDGGWYISGMPSIIGVYTDLLAALEPSDVDDFTSFFEDSVDSAFDLADPFGVGDPFGMNDPFMFEEPPVYEELPFEEEEGYDPFAEEEPVEDPMQEIQPDLTPEMVETFVPGLEITPSDAAQAYFAGEVGIPARWYGYAYATDGRGGVEIVAFDVSADELIAGLDGSAFYTRVEVDGLPDGAVAFDWEGIDRAIVIDNYIVSAYFEANDDLPAVLLEQVNAIAAAR